MDNGQWTSIPSGKRKSEKTMDDGQWTMDIKTIKETETERTSLKQIGLLSIVHCPTSKPQNIKHNGKKSNTRKVHVPATGGGTDQRRASEKRCRCRGVFLRRHLHAGAVLGGTSEVPLSPTDHNDFSREENRRSRISTTQRNNLIPDIRRL